MHGNDEMEYGIAKGDNFLKTKTRIRITRTATDPGVEAYTSYIQIASNSTASGSVKLKWLYRFNNMRDSIYNYINSYSTAFTIE